MANDPSGPTDAQLSAYFAEGFDPGIAEVTDRGRMWLRLRESLVRDARIRRQANERIRAGVQAARDQGIPWSLIGEDLGVSAEKARRMYDQSFKGRVRVSFHGHRMGLKRKKAENFRK